MTVECLLSSRKLWHETICGIEVEGKRVDYKCFKDRVIRHILVVVLIVGISHTVDSNVNYYCGLIAVVFSIYVNWYMYLSQCKTWELCGLDICDLLPWFYITLKRAYFLCWTSRWVVNHDMKNVTFIQYRITFHVKDINTSLLFSGKCFQIPWISFFLCPKGLRLNELLGKC